MVEHRRMERRARQLVHHCVGCNHARWSMLALFRSHTVSLYTTARIAKPRTQSHLMVIARAISHSQRAHHCAQMQPHADAHCSRDPRGSKDWRSPPTIAPRAITRARAEMVAQPGPHGRTKLAVLCRQLRRELVRRRAAVARALAAAAAAVVAASREAPGGLPPCKAPRTYGLSGYET
jgi:hypothetical protein